MASPQTNRQSIETTKPKILLVDDEVMLCDAVCVLLKSDYSVTAVQTIDDAKSVIARESFHLAILDLCLPDGDGMNLIAGFRTLNPPVPVVIMTGYGSIDVACEAMRRGAVDFIQKPFDAHPFLNTIRAALRHNEPQEQRPLSLPTAGEPSADQLGDAILSATVNAFVHNLNGHLGALQAYADLVKGVLPGIPGGVPEKLQRFCGGIEDNIETIHYLFERLRNTIGRHPGILRPTDVQAIIAEVERYLSKTFAAKISLNLAVAPSEIMGDHELLWHLFENLIRNGLEAVQARENGLVEVSTSVDAAGENFSVVVRDNGVGIAADVLPRIFDPDYSTKRRGLGVGLYIVRRATQIHGGQIECRSALGNGTTFTVSLPLLAATKHKTS